MVNSTDPGSADPSRRLVVNFPPSLSKKNTIIINITINVVNNVVIIILLKCTLSRNSFTKYHTINDRIRGEV